MVVLQATEEYWLSITPIVHDENEKCLVFQCVAVLHNEGSGEGTPQHATAPKCGACHPARHEATQQRGHGKAPHSVTAVERCSLSLMAVCLFISEHLTPAQG
jgi:hypothetical protein